MTRDGEKSAIVRCQESFKTLSQGDANIPYQCANDFWSHGDIETELKNTICPEIAPKKCLIAAVGRNENFGGQWAELQGKVVWDFGRKSAYQTYIAHQKKKSERQQSERQQKVERTRQYLSEVARLKAEIKALRDALAR